MKDKILTFIIGLLVGAIITTGICYIYEKNVIKSLKEENSSKQEQFQGSNGMMQKDMMRNPNGDDGMMPRDKWQNGDSRTDDITSSENNQNTKTRKNKMDGEMKTEPNNNQESNELNL